MIEFSTGIPALDQLLHNVKPGDNVVFQVNSIQNYIPFVHAFCIDNEEKERPLIYFRFGNHVSLIPENIKAETFEVHPEEGFEHFIDEIFSVIKKYGRGAAYVFDSLSELAVDWYSDRMVANFFMLTCPYLFDFETGTYFALFRNQHSQYTISQIHNTAQIILDVYKKQGQFYIHPLKVWKRHSPTMYMLHAWKEEGFIPVNNSAEISEILSHHTQPWVDFTKNKLDIWSRTLSKAYEISKDFENFAADQDKVQQLKKRIIRMIITRDKKLLNLAKKYFDLKTLLNIGQRMMGTGLIGGKSVGMLLAQNILRKENSKWDEILEQHDSFFIGSDVFYTYLVMNDCWWIRYNIRKSDDIKKSLDLAAQARKILEKGRFSEEILQQFNNMLNYYGQSPIIVRSSSLLEDAYGNAFAGKYDSVFLVNQGPPEERLAQFINAIRQVYKSTLSERALIYRSRRNLLDKDEQMAILVQRVSGSRYGHLFYPQLAGVGYSFNPFIWDKAIDPDAGMLRLVFGLGTRAVEKADDDYTRIIALNAPEKRPEDSHKQGNKYNQRKVDVLNLKENQFSTKDFNKVMKLSENFPKNKFASRDYRTEQIFHRRNIDKVVYRLDLDKLIKNSNIINDMREIQQTLSNVYNYSVDIEFTINFFDDKNYRIYILQCRPLQVKSELEKFKAPTKLPEQNLIFKTAGPIIGYGIAKPIDRLIYVVPEAYANLSIKERHTIARIIGKINRKQSDLDDFTVFLAGPGRWATTSPSLGIPVAFQEINTVSIICEIAEMHENLVPDASLGTHFFNDLVENDMLYISIKPNKDESMFNETFFNTSKNRVSELLEDGEHYKDIIRVVDIPRTADMQVKIYADPIEQIAILYWEET